MVGYELLGTPQRDITPKKQRGVCEKQARASNGAYFSGRLALAPWRARFSAAADLCAQRIRSRKASLGTRATRTRIHS